MNRILKNSFSGTAILLLFLLSLSQAVMAQEAVPLLPMTIKGVALINGAPAPDGTVVGTYLSGQPVEKLRVSGSSGDYCFWISGTARDEGKLVTFSVDGRSTGDIVPWNSGKQILSLDLSVGEGTYSGNSITGLYSKLNSETLTEIGKLKAFGKKSKTSIIESSVPEPDLEALRNIKAGAGDKESTQSSEGSSQLKSTPDFPIIYAVAGIVGIALGRNLRGRSSRKR